MSILPPPRRPKLNTSVTVWAQNAPTWEMMQWVTECRSVPELFEFISAKKSAPAAHQADALAQQQIQTLMAAETHEHLRALRAPPVLQDPRTYVAFVSGALAGWIANILSK
jgi:hypothetical protein